jgi:alkylhydroperoxidase family enzyme
LAHAAEQHAQTHTKAKLAYTARMSEYSIARERIVEALLNTPGELSASQRDGLLRYARGEPDAPTPEPGLRPLIDKALTQAFKIVDADIARLRDAGYSEDALYEAIVTAAAGAGLRRIDAGLRALDAVRED